MASEAKSGSGVWYESLAGVRGWRSLWQAESVEFVAGGVSGRSPRLAEFVAGRVCGRSLWPEFVAGGVCGRSLWLAECGRSLWLAESAVPHVAARPPHTGNTPLHVRRTLTTLRERGGLPLTETKRAHVASWFPNACEARARGLHVVGGRGRAEEEVPRGVS
jgi:hypothetical protein